MAAKMAAKIEDSKRVKVIVTRKYGEEKHKIFSSTMINKNGKYVLEQFRVPVDVEVELPVEVIEQLKGRGVAKFVEGKQKMVPEFSIEKL